MIVFRKICIKHPELGGRQYARFRKGISRTGTCTGCSNEQGKRWRAENVEKWKESQRKWYSNNPEKIAAKEARRVRDKTKLSEMNKRWREKNAAYCKEKDRQKRVLNKERIREKMKRWYEKNKHLVYANNIKRRCEEIRATPSWANQFFLKEAYALAVLRSKVTGVKWSVDHIVPLRSKLVCGLHTHQNIRVIPAAENNSKSNRYWPQMP